MLSDNNAGTVLRAYARRDRRYSLHGYNEGEKQDKGEDGTTIIRLKMKNSRVETYRSDEGSEHFFIRESIASDVKHSGSDEGARGGGNETPDDDERTLDIHDGNSVSGLLLVHLRQLQYAHLCGLRAAAA